MNSPLRTLQSHSAADVSGDVVHSLGPWFHNLHLPDGRQTAPDHPLGDYPAYKWAALGPQLPLDLQGKTVLDIGCNAGYFAIELARRGAHVTAMDHDPHYLRQASWATAQFGLGDRLSLRQGDIYDLTAEGSRYDIVLFLGVLYHLRYPLLGLDLAASVCRDTLVFQSLATGGPVGPADGEGDPGYLGRERLREDGWPRMAFIEHELAGDPTNWWVPNPAALHAMVRSTGYSVTAMADDILICRRGAGAEAAARRCHDMVAKLGSAAANEEVRHVG
ncbi:methyltransferase domain-containing protein [Luteibacter sp. 9135]|uniref:methyltransferase domain-containing protein n=1 Tax=Luteibacter sp. 9135 TaxID=1500893 RepID=UPI0006921A72|nr:methyltransferase domain-containing protein [Luteibacter sp. 9135]